LGFLGLIFCDENKKNRKKLVQKKKHHVWDENGDI
jgi:hypothetical protein